MHAYTHTYIYIQTYIYIYAYIYTHTHIYICVYIYMNSSGALWPRANVVGIFLSVSDFHIDMPGFLLLSGATEVSVHVVVGVKNIDSLFLALPPRLNKITIRKLGGQNEMIYDLSLSLSLYIYTYTYIYIYTHTYIYIYI